jgi:microcystin-dependent protein
MALTPFLGEIVLYSFNFPPKGWAMCNGQLLPINQNQALFSILGTTYGGNGQTTFALPDMRGRVGIGVGNGHTLGEAGGEEMHTLTVAELPAHFHTVSANTTQAPASLAGVVPDNTKAVAPALVSQQGGTTTPAQIFGTGGPDRQMPQGLALYGGNQPHENRQPYGVLNYCIALQGVFPSQN